MPSRSPLGHFDRNSVGFDVSVHGPDVQRETVEQVGNALIGLHHEVAKNLGYSGPPMLRLAGVSFRCDACDFRQPFEASRDGWHHADGNDYCPMCLVGDKR